MTKAKPLPSIDRVRELLDYNPLTGDLLWWAGMHNNGVNAGDKAGYSRNGRYWVISIDGKKYLAHRLAWLLGCGEDPGEFDVEHKDENKMNNRLDNLRLATRSQNKANQRKSKGYSLCRSTGRWKAKIGVNGKTLNLGRFATEEEARQAYVSAKLHHFGEFAAT
jgi:hypothetical protein